MTLLSCLICFPFLKKCACWESKFHIINGKTNSNFLNANVVWKGKLYSQRAEQIVGTNRCCMVLVCIACFVSKLIIAKPERPLIQTWPFYCEWGPQETWQELNLELSTLQDRGVIHDTGEILSTNVYFGLHWACKQGLALVSTGLVIYTFGN